MGVESPLTYPINEHFFFDCGCLLGSPSFPMSFSL